MSFQNEHIVETKSCPQCGVSFDITDKDLEFYEKVSPVFQGKKYTIPSPTLCPECRVIRRYVWRNEGKLYKRQCDKTGDSIVSIFSPDKKYNIYRNDVWYSDAWDPMSYGVIWQANQSFFHQFDALLHQVPIQNAFIGGKNENADYGNHTGDMKSSYMCFASWRLEECTYVSRGLDNYHVVDAFGSVNCKDSYQVMHSSDCYKCFFILNSHNCGNSYFLRDCDACEYCFGCVSLKNKKYHIFNQPYSKQDYFDKIQQLIQDSTYDWSYMNQLSITGTIFRASNIIGSQNVTGDSIHNSSDVHYGFFISDVEKSKYIENGGEQANNIYDCYGFGFELDLGYESIDVGVKSYKNSFNVVNHQCNNVYYSFNCYQSAYLFGCSGLRNKQYCILNKQYSKQEYEVLVPKIIAKMREDREWGEFFPYSLSPFGYNETIAQDTIPLNKDQAFSRGCNWSDYEAPFPKVEKVIPASKLPDNIQDIPDDILNWAIECEMTKKPFRIIPQELEFYRKHNLPIPRRHPDQRHLDRMSLRNPRKLFERVCDHPNCTIVMQTTYASERPEKVYCEKCYNKEVY